MWCINIYYVSPCIIKKDTYKLHA